MGLVRSTNTKPELLVRHMIHALGFRYRLHRADLPGHPDIVLPSRKKIVFIHGCFWHGHACKLGRMPKSRFDYWPDKIKRNRERDIKTLRRLRGMRWKCLVLWECEVRSARNAENVQGKLMRFLK